MHASCYAAFGNSVVKFPMFRNIRLYEIFLALWAQLVHPNFAFSSRGDVLDGVFVSGELRPTLESLEASALQQAPSPGQRSLLAEAELGASRQYGSTGVPFTMSQVTSFDVSGA